MSRYALLCYAMLHSYMTLRIFTQVLRQLTDAQAMLRQALRVEWQAVREADEAAEAVRRTQEVAAEARAVQEELRTRAMGAVAAVREGGTVAERLRAVTKFCKQVEGARREADWGALEAEAGWLRCRQPMVEAVEARVAAEIEVARLERMLEMEVARVEGRLARLETERAEAVDVAHLWRAEAARWQGQAENAMGSMQSMVGAREEAVEVAVVGGGLGGAAVSEAVDGGSVSGAAVTEAVDAAVTVDVVVAEAAEAAVVVAAADTSEWL